MPLRGENSLVRIVRAIAKEDGFSFGNPWVSDGSQAMVLPIVATSTRPRHYVLAEEVPGRIYAQDLGRIDRLRIHNDSGSRVLLRSGVLFRGEQTQPRGTTASVMLDPQSTVDIEVKCVCMSRAIAAGATLEPAAPIAPDIIHEALLRCDQGGVWASIRATVQAVGPAASDDLLAALTPASNGDDDSEEVAQTIRVLEGMCGAFILDEDGVLAAELFDSPLSWAAVSQSILRRYTHVLHPRPGSPLKAIANPEAAVALAKEFLNAIVKAESHRTARESWIVDSPLAEYTATQGEVIHLVAFRAGSPSLRGAAKAPVGGYSHLGAPTGTQGLGESLWSNMLTPGTVEAADGDVAVAETGAIELPDDSEPAPPSVRLGRRKVLTSGWDTGTFQALEHCSRKEFGGDRSAAMRFLVRQGLRRRGYMGPQPAPREPTSIVSIGEPENALPAMEGRRASLEARIGDLERIVQTDEYAGWLRERARLELERLESATDDEVLQAAIRSALQRLPPIPPTVEASEPVEVEAPPTAPPVDIPGILRRAFSASASADLVQALALFDEVLEVEPDNATALLGRAIALRRAGKSKEALADLDLVLSLQPTNAAALMNRARILQDKGDLREALLAFDRLAVIAPNDWDVWMARGDLLVKLGRDEDALRAYGEALRRNPDDEKLQRRMRALQRSSSAPPAEEPRRSAAARGVEEGQSYLVKEKRPALSYRLLKTLAAQKVPTLVITRQSPDGLRRDQGFAGSRILGLSHAPSRDLHSPTALPALSKVIERFVEENQGQGAILLDGLEYLIANNGFRETILFVEHVNEFIVQRRAIVLIPVAPDAVAEKEFALLERSLKVLE